jgi:hypothetical protein
MDRKPRQEVELHESQNRLAVQLKQWLRNQFHETKSFFGKLTVAYWLLKIPSLLMKATFQFHQKPSFLRLFTKIQIFWDRKPCQLMNSCRCLKGAYYFPSVGRRSIYINVCIAVFWNASEFQPEYVAWYPTWRQFFTCIFIGPLLATYIYAASPV